MIKSRLFALVALLFIAFSNTSAQNGSSNAMSVAIALHNPSSEINDGVAKVEVTGGVAPYQYKWSNINTPLDDAESVGLIEGMEHSVTVSDANGTKITKTFKIPAESITEIFNSKVQPAVDVLGAVLFWDAFATAGLYDPVVYASHRNLPLSAKDITSDQKYTFKKMACG